MRDVLFLPSTIERELVISTDCSGGIGEKPGDIVSVSNRLVSYYSMRVAMMELLAVGAAPKAVILANFSGDQSWHDYIAGIHQVYEELQINPLPLVGSTETNMSLHQSAIGLTVLGEIHKQHKRIKRTPGNAMFAVIGAPLVGDKVITEKDRVAPLSLFRTCLELEGIYEVVPVGSKGILYELELLLIINEFSICKIVGTSLNLDASSGPATCFIISYDVAIEEKLHEIAGQYFYKLKIQC